MDRIVALTKTMFNVPTVLVTLVLEDRMLFLSTIGWHRDESNPRAERMSAPLDSGLCPHRMITLEGEEPECMVLNTKDDWRFKNNVSLH